MSQSEQARPVERHFQHDGPTTHPGETLRIRHTAAVLTAAVLLAGCSGAATGDPGRPGGRTGLDAPVVGPGAEARDVSR